MFSHPSRWAEIPTCQCANRLDSLTTVLGWQSNISYSGPLSILAISGEVGHFLGVVEGWKFHFCGWFRCFVTNHWDQKRIKAKKKRHLKVLERNLFKLPIFPVEKFNKNSMGTSGLLSWRCWFGRWSFPSMPWPWNSSWCAGQCLWVKLRKAEVALHHR